MLLLTHIFMEDFTITTIVMHIIEITEEEQLPITIGIEEIIV